MDIEDFHQVENENGEAADKKPKRQKKTLEQRIAAKEAELKKLKAQAKGEERKARTKRLIETGATIENALGIEFSEKVDREILQGVLLERHGRNDGSEWTWAEAIARACIEKGVGSNHES